MSLTRINNNIGAINANRNLDKTSSRLQKSMERLSSGLRINRSGDDAAGMTVATRIRSQVAGLNRAIMNAQDGINLINVAEGAMDEITVRLNRMRVLAIQAGNTGVNDIQARQALQDEVFQSIDEISRISETSQFNTNRLLNGDFKIDTQVKPGQDGLQTYGIHIDQSPTANTLADGLSFLNVVKTNQGYEHIIAGESAADKQPINCGITDQTDIAVSLGHWTSPVTIDGTNATAATGLSASFFQGVSLYAGDTISFQGVLSDGVTKYGGALSVGGGNTLATLITQINTQIENAQMAHWGVQSTANVPQSYRITATLGTGANAGRIILQNSTTTFSQASVDIYASRTSGAGELVSKSEGMIRGLIGEASILSGRGKVGNAVTAITGSTFDTGQFTITVEDVVGSQQRVTQSLIEWTDRNGSLLGRTGSLGAVSTAAVMNGTFVEGVYQGGATLFNNSTITLTGVEVDGTSFEASFTLDTTLTATTDTNYNDFRFQSISGLIEEINYRTRSYTAYTGTLAINDGERSRFELSQFTFTNGGLVQLVDDFGITNSKTSFTLTFRQNKFLTDPTAEHVTIQDDAELRREGFAETATFRVNGGEAVRAEAGDVITLYGTESTIDKIPTPHVTLRVGSGFSIGSDILEVEAQEFVGSLNGGPAVTFQNGDQDVVFIDNGSHVKGVAQYLTVDFDGILDITKNTTGAPDAGTTLIISTVNRSMNFQVGAFSNQNFRISVGDLSAENLGFGRDSGRTVADIDITTVSGVNEALRIIDEALDQVNRTRSLMGAATNRLESTVANLSVSVENLSASESRLRDADIARESSEFTKNQVMLQAGTSVLAQANFIAQGFLSLLG
ncbi:MAG: flagellin [bacterium]